MRLATLACAAAVFAAVTPARAQVETGRLNVHVQLALTLSSTQLGLPSSATDTSAAVGLMGNAGIDWQFRAPFALDLNLALGHLGLIAGGGGEPGAYVIAVGPRWRFIDGPAGDGYVVPRVGYLLNRTDDSSFGTVELEAGGEITVDGPVRLGPFLRVAAAFGPTNFAYFVVGVDLTAVVLRRLPPRPKPKPQPTDWTPGEDDDDSAPALAPPPPPADSDGDGVLDRDDACPDTKPGSRVDARGCVVLAPQVVLEGITFLFDSSQIQPASEDALARAAQLLRDNPAARVEIGGHTCDIGSDKYNLELSQARAAAVADWLVEHGIARDRLEVHGYGNTQPKVPNDSEENRALNRRIEFRRLDH
jgi:outer membrane protein OmpA-like peptidoglycan-associated protein